MKLSAKNACLAVAAAFVVIPSVGVAATSVKGKVVNTDDLLNPVWNEAMKADSHRYTFREPSASVPAKYRILRGHISKELCIVALGEDDAKPLKNAIRVVIEGGRTSQVTLVVAPNQEIVFENHDPTEHALYGATEGSFGRVSLAPDNGSGTPSTFKWSPPGPGKWEIRDELSPSLRTWIVVEPKLAKEADPKKGIATFPNRRGDFEMALDLDPAKKYTLVAYYNGEAVGTPLPIEIKPVNNAAPPTIELKDPLKAGPDKGGSDKANPDKPSDPAKQEEPKKGGG